MPLEERSHLRIARKLAAASLFQALANRRQRVIVKLDWLVPLGNDREQQFGGLVLLCVGQFEGLGDRLFKQLGHDHRSVSFNSMRRLRL
jgi:hypothetical protein